MARVAVFVPDLLFGSAVLGSVRAAGHDAELLPNAERVRARAPGARVLIVDLTSEAAERVALVGELRESGALEGTSTLAFYSHVEVETRELAREAAFDRVVPRSRMAREGAALVGALVAES